MVGAVVLDGIRVLDRTAGIAGPYCTKVLADAGADVVKVEPPDGDPLRRHGSGALFEYLNASKRSVVGPHHELEAAADVLVVDGVVDVAALRRANPALVVVTITPFGFDGPWVGRPATEFTLQAAAGSTGSRGLPDREPLAAGGRLGEWLTGTYAAAGALAALLHVRRGGEGEHVDVAALDCVATAMTTAPSVFSSFMGWPPISGTGRTVEVPSVEPTTDGYVVFTTNSAQQYHDFCVLIGRPDLLEDRSLARAHNRFLQRERFEAAVHAYTTTRTTEQVLAEAALLRIPCAPVLDGASVTAFHHFVERGVFVPAPSGRFAQPRVPYRISGTEPRPFAPAPVIGADTVTVGWEPRTVAASARDGRPLEGVRIVDCTAWWAGPSATEALACLGADVVKVESVTRPDFMRYAATKPPDVDRWWEWGPIFHVANAGKRGVTIDLGRPEGITLLERLLRSAEVLVENYTPRVMEQFGLGWDRVHELHPDLVMVRMPAFGLDGPWRDHTGFAQTMECVAGMAWRTGFPEGPPVLVRGACDPLAGMHAVIATLLALVVRDRDGGGRLVESVMVEAALNAAAEQIVEHGASGTLLSRLGNRSPDALLQGVYPCAGDDRWVAVSVESDEQLAALRKVVGYDEDEAVATWTSDRDADEVVELLVAAGVPAAVVIAAPDVARNPQLRHRGLFEVEDHPVTGRHELPTLPFRFSRIDRWLPGPAPVLGEHNDAVLTELGYDAGEIAALREASVIGDRPVGA